MKALNRPFLVRFATGRAIAVSVVVLAISSIFALGMLWMPEPKTTSSPTISAQVSRPGFVGTQDEINDGASLALAMDVPFIEIASLEIAGLDLLVVDLRWLIVDSTSVEANAIQGVLKGGMLLSFVQVGANITRDQVSSFLARTEPWPITITAAGTETHPPTDENSTVYPLPDDRVPVYVQFAQLEALVPGEFRLVIGSSLGELSNHSWGEAELAVRDLLLRSMDEAGVRT